MQRQVVQPKKEEKGPLVQIKLGSASKSNASGGGAGAGGGFKKGGFKNAFGAAEKADVRKDDDSTEAELRLESVQDVEMTKEEELDSDLTDQEDYYDPKRPTGCTPACSSVVARARG